MLPGVRSRRFVSGRMGQCKVPNWTALEQLLGSDELCAHFMWMFDVVLGDGSLLNAYKHRWTRRYLHLAEDADTFQYVGDDLYRLVEPSAAIEGVFTGWECVKPTPEEQRALRAALRRAAS